MDWSRDRPLLDDWDRGPLSAPWAPNTNSMDVQMDLTDNVVNNNIQSAGDDGVDNHSHQHSPSPDRQHHQQQQQQQQQYDDVQFERKQFYFYNEASIYLAEGANNDKFNTHPHNHEALPAYQAAHNNWFYTLDFCAALVVVLLAVAERPAVKYFALPVGIHSSIEMLCLLILSLELGIRYKWLGCKLFFKHKRTMFKLFVIILMLVETIVVLVRQTNHFRVTRALRPLFLLHTHYCRGVRRITRQIIQCLPPIAEMLALLLFFMLIFSILGFYLFAGIPDDTYFRTIQDSFISLFVLLTTANYPDVMMPAYNVSTLYSFFFIIYLSLELYLLVNLLLAVVYDTFLNLEKTKLRALYIHKKEGCDRAFRLLSTQSGDHDTLDVKNFVGMMEHFVPNRTRKEYYLMFKFLNTKKTGELTLHEFYNVYTASRFVWKLKSDSNLWSSSCPFPFSRAMEALHWFVTWSVFDYCVYVVIAGNFTWILIETVRISLASIDPSSYDFTASWVSIIFVCSFTLLVFIAYDLLLSPSVYSVEATLKILGRGPRDYFTQGWDVFDFLVTLVSVVGVFGAVFENSFYYVMVLRPFRLLRLFKLNKRYRDVLGTLFVLFYKLLSLAVCILIVYYFYAIIGIEMFHNRDLRNCCKNTSVESYYEYNNVTKRGGYYYLNNFDNLLMSGVTLFELTVVNNWFIIMDGYAHAVSQWSRIYFMCFYITMMVVLNIIVAFVLESFMFRINYRRQMEVDDIEEDHGVEKQDLFLSEIEMDMVSILSQPLTGQFIAMQANREIENAYHFVGERNRDRDDFSLSMCKDEVKNWSSEYERNRKSMVDSMSVLRVRNRPNSESMSNNSFSLHRAQSNSMSSNFSVEV